MSIIIKEWLLKIIVEFEEEWDVMSGVVNEDVVMVFVVMKLVLVLFEVEFVVWLLLGGGVKNNVSFDSGNVYVV